MGRDESTKIERRQKEQRLPRTREKKRRELLFIRSYDPLNKSLSLEEGGKRGGISSKESSSLNSRGEKGEKRTR